MKKLNEIVTYKVGNIDLTADFEELNQELLKTIDKYNNVVVCDEQRADFKKELADLRKMKTNFEDGRKNIKKEFEKPYKEFEAAYKTNILSPLDEVIENIDSQIKNIEQNLVDLKRLELETYFNSINKLEWLKMEKMELKLGLTSKVEVEKVNIDNFIKSIETDLLAIKQMKDSDFIEFEYKRNGFNFAKAVATNAERKKDVKVEVVEKPKQEETKVKMIFKVCGTMEQMKDLKKFIESKNIEILA